MTVYVPHLTHILGIISPVLELQEQCPEFASGGSLKKYVPRSTRSKYCGCDSSWPFAQFRSRHYKLFRSEAKKKNPLLGHVELM